MEQAATFPDAVTWIELAGLAGAALVPLTLADGLSLREAPSQSLGETIARFLGERQYCLSLDNCGHLPVRGLRHAGGGGCCLPSPARSGHQPRAAGPARGDSLSRAAALAACRRRTNCASDPIEKTVRTYVSNVCAKLQVADRAEAILRARETGMGPRAGR